MDLLAEANAVATVGISPELRKRRIELNNQIITIQTALGKQQAQTTGSQDPNLVKDLKETIGRLEREESMVLKQIEKQHPRYAELIKPKPVTLTELRENILQDVEVVLEYTMTDDGMAVFVISKKVFTVIQVEISTAQLRQDVEQIRAMLTSPDKFDNSIIYKLYIKMFQPVEKYLTNTKVVYIIPDGDLYYLPFEILMRSDELQNQSSNFLLANPHHYVFTYVPSASILFSIRNDSRWNQPRSNQYPFLAFGNPVYSKDALEQDGEQLTPINQRSIDIMQSLQNKFSV